jgi:hypothetical protein
MDPSMPGEDYDTSAMMMFSGAERRSESGRNGTISPMEEQQSYAMVQTDG